VNFTYEISSVTVNGSDQAVVKFRILKDGTPVTFNTYAAGAALLTGFTGSPSFLLAWAEAQDGITAPADYNNLGNSAGQPTSVSITNLWNGSDGSLSSPDGSGYYTATLTADPFPSGAGLRAVALQGYFTQVTPSVARHTVSAFMPVSGDTARRVVVDSDKCANCHEWFEGHGGNRVRTTEVCITCHVPNLSSSGRTKDLSTYVPGSNSNTDAAIAAAGNDSLKWPEDTNNFKDLIHGIHAAHFRENHFEFVRIRSNNAYYFDWSHVTFPGELNNCETCHEDGTYLPASVPANALWTNTRTTTGNPAETHADVAGARASLPNDTDLVNTPISSACHYCHDSAAAASHMELNGGAIGWERGDAVAEAPVESCIVCHGEGKIADVEAAHSGDE
jgi:OmcA/MtrC family decaheme c-type cytochrome